MICVLPMRVVHRSVMRFMRSKLFYLALGSAGIGGEISVARLALRFASMLGLAGPAEGYSMLCDAAGNRAISTASAIITP